MGKGDRFWRLEEKRRVLKELDRAGEVADSVDVRIELARKIESGELTLTEAQNELKKIKRDGKRNGLRTRAKTFRWL